MLTEFQSAPHVKYILHEVDDVLRTFGREEKTCFGRLAGKKRTVSGSVVAVCGLERVENKLVSSAGEIDD